MKAIKVLDCTLRDGGYCNNWEFGYENIKHVVSGLMDAGVDYIECGFLTNKIGYEVQKSKYTSLDQLREIIPNTKNNKLFLVMINYGEYKIENIPNCNETIIDGIRVAFHKKDIKEALDFCKALLDKGYLVFVQPMVSMSYSEDEFISLIKKSNQLNPAAFYIVDSFGTMKRKQLLLYVELVKKYLDPNICIGFHAHNNLQLAYSNAQFLTELNLDRTLIVDASIHGMGRGAGNLNAELYLEYLNDCIDAKYNIKSILNLLDEVISGFYEEKPWGYSLPNYLSAIHMIHPNYATYLSSKKTLTYEAMDEIFNTIDPKRGVEYDEEYIESLYTDYLSNRREAISSLDELANYVKNRKMLLIAPGKNALKQKDIINKFVEEQSPVIISINHDYPYLNSDYIFVSNMRRFRQLKQNSFHKTIITSNIDYSDVYACVDYTSLLNSFDGVKDNAGLMALKLFSEMNCTDFFLAGFDGYSYDDSSNFESKEMIFANSKDMVEKLNLGMKEALGRFSKLYHVEFVTDSLLKD